MTSHELVVPTAFRLDLTSALLRRFPATAVEPERADKAFVCGWSTDGKTVIATIRQPERARIQVEILHGGSDFNVNIQRIRLMLGLDRDPIERAVGRAEWLAQLGERFCGAWPARTSTIWEAAVNAIVFQSVSMLAAGAVMNRFVNQLGRRIPHRAGTFVLFPAPGDIRAAADYDLRGLGLSNAKVIAIRALATAFARGDWDVAALETLPTPALCDRLTQARGIGPWSAAVIALRGFGRLDVFPANDSGVVRTVGRLSGQTPGATADALAALGETRGMLYHYLLLARLHDRGLLCDSLLAGAADL